MINRVLIRIKVIQILYSYLLTRSEFKIEQAPETTSRDKRFAYTVYLRLLLLILELSGYSARNDNPEPRLKEAVKNKYLHASKTARALAFDDTIRKAILKGGTGIETFHPLLPALFSAIVNSSAYRSYTHLKSRDIADDVKLWASVIETVIAHNEEFLSAMRADENFTLRGYEAGVKMVVDTLKDFSDNRSMLPDAEKSLETSLEKAYHLYLALLALPVALTNLEEERIEAGRNKHLPTAEDLNPNTRFVDNELVKLLGEHTELRKPIEGSIIDWAGEPMLLRKLMERIRESDIYKEYMDAKDTDLERDCELWRKLMRCIVLPSDDLVEMLEDKSVYWNDDLEIVGTFVIKTFRRFCTAGQDIQAEILPPFKDEEDERFGNELFNYAVKNANEYRSYIDRFINRQQWDSERLAFMDIVIMVTAIAEIINYPAIPIPVSLNEYIEIANCYSTPKSGQFINGILYSVINYLKKENILNKPF